MKCTLGDPRSTGFPESDRRPGVSSRFSVPTSSGAPRRQPPDAYTAPRREEHFPRPPPSPPGFSSASYETFYNNQEDMTGADYWKRSDAGRSRADRGDERENYVPYDVWKEKSREHSAHWQPLRATSNSGNVLYLLLCCLRKFFFFRSHVFFS